MLIYLIRIDSTGTVYCSTKPISNLTCNSVECWLFYLASRLLKPTINRLALTLAAAQLRMCWFSRLSPTLSSEPSTCIKSESTTITQLCPSLTFTRLSNLLFSQYFILIHPLFYPVFLKYHEILRIGLLNCSPCPNYLYNISKQASYCLNLKFSIVLIIYIK